MDLAVEQVMDNIQATFEKTAGERCRFIGSKTEGDRLEIQWKVGNKTFYCSSRFNSGGESEAAEKIGEIAFRKADMDDGTWDKRMDTSRRLLASLQRSH